MKKAYSQIVALLLFFSLGFSQRNYNINFNDKDFVPIESIDFSKQLLESQVGAKSYVFIQFYSIPSVAQKQKIEDRGIKLYDHLPNYAYSAVVPVDADLSDLNIRSVFSLKTEDKISTLLKNKEFLPPHILKNGKVEVVLNYHSAISLAEISLLLENRLSVINKIDDVGAYVKMEIPYEDLNFWAAQVWTIFIEPAFGPDEPENYEARVSQRSNYVFQEFVGGNKFNGTGIKVSLNDDGPISEHIDFKGRIDESQTGNNNGTHGDHCAGTLMGAGNLQPNTRGSAFGADLKVYNVYGAFDNMFSDYNNQGIVITSTSYGNGCNAGYTGFSRTLDIQTRQLKNLTHVFSAGNSGQETCTYGAGVGWGTITGGHKVAKNVVVVGSITKADQISPFSSRGPTRDGRIKPDIVAVGSSVLSTIGNPANTYSVFSGTSMACPGVAGLMAQLYEAYNTTYNVNPLSHTARAILLNSADDLGNPGPDFTFGYGRVNGRRSLNTILDGRFLIDSVQNEQSKTFSINVTEGKSELRIMLSWTDFEAVAGSQSPLLNDLDIKVIAPNGEEFLPWVLDPTPNVTNLTAQAVRGEDHLNLNEQVTIQNPIPGVYQIVVNGFYVPMGNFSTFTLAHEIIEDEVVITFPNGGEKLTTGQPITIRWDSYGSLGSFNLSFSPDEGVSWYPIFNNINENVRNHNWNVPNLVTGKMLVKVTRGNKESVSKNVNVINIPTNLATQNACPDNYTISWESVNGATAYVVYLLGEKYMEEIDTVSGLSYTFQGLDFTQQQWVSVSALGINEAIGNRANAIQLFPDENECPLDFDLALEELIFPYNGIVPACIFEGDQSIKFRMKNIGLLSFSEDVTFFAQLNGQQYSSVTIDFTSIPSSGNILEVSFPNELNINNNIGINEMKIWAVSNLDNNTTNDTLHVQFEVVLSSSQSLPIFQDFESFNLNASTANCAQELQTLGDGWVNLSNGWGDDVDWRVFSGPTPTSSTGPAVDFSEGTEQGKYIYLEANNCFSRKAELYSPCINLENVNVPVLTYAYHLFGANIGSLSIDVLTQNGWENLQYLEGNQGNTWFNPEINLQNFSGSNAMVRFTGIIGEQVRSDLALDAIGVSVFNDIPTASFSTSASFICENSVVALSNQSTGYPQSYTWQIEPNFGFQYINQTNENSANPQILFQNSGVYQILLISENANGADTFSVSTAITVGEGQAYPIFEDFSSPNLQQGWSRSVSFNGESWNRSSLVTGIDGNPTNAMFVSNFNFALLTDSHYIQTQPIKLENSFLPELTFDLAYAPRNTTFNDGLLIQVSTDCGNTFEDAYLKMGSDLATTTFSGNQYVPFNANQWRTDTVNLSSYVNQTIVLRFVNINRFGNNIYLDNINIGEQGVKALLSAENTCVNENVVFTSNSIGNIDTYQWEFGADANPNSASGVGPHIVTYSSIGTKQVSLTVEGVNGTDSDIFPVIIANEPQAEFSYTSNNLSVSFETQEIALSYLWDFGDGETSNLQNPTHQYNQSGIYQVSLTVENECGESEKVETITVETIGLNAITSENGFKIFPNPGSDLFYIELPETNSDLYLSLTDLSGRIVFNTMYPKNTPLASINTSLLPRGMYLVKVYNNEVSSVLRWLKIDD